MNGGAYQSTFRIGLVGATVTAPIRLNDGGLYNASRNLWRLRRFGISEEARYTFANAGLYLDGSFEYDFDLSGAFGLTCWVQGTWMSIPGGGNVDLAGKSSGGRFTPLGVPVFIFPPDFYGASGSSRESGLSEYSLNIGIKGILTF